MHRLENKYLMGILEGEDGARLFSEVLKRKLEQFELQKAPFKHSKNNITVLVVKQ